MKFVSWERHGLALAVAAILVRERDRLVVAVRDGLVEERGAVDVAAEVFEDDRGPLHDGLGEDHPALVGDGRQRDTCAASQLQKPPPKAGGWFERTLPSFSAQASRFDDSNQPTIPLPAARSGPQATRVRLRRGADGRSPAGGGHPYRWPRKDRLVFERWKQETHWGKLFSA